VRQRDRESLSDSDPHGLLFGPSDDDELFADEDEQRHPLPRVQRVSRSELRAERGQRAARRRNGRLLLLLSALLVVVVVVATWLVVVPIYHFFKPKDYTGTGTGTAIVEVRANDNAKAIGTTLHNQGVVASVKAFTDAAKKDSRSQSIQPGSYKLRKHMSAKSALALLLNPASRVNSDVVVPEGATAIDVLKRLTARPCPDKAPATAVCGPGMNRAEVQKALEDVKAIGLPIGYTANGKTPASLEGFLYPATYYFPENTNPVAALGDMVAQFTEQVRTSHFTAAASKLHITPYQELIIASIAQAEAKYPEDYGKVARVILNRLIANKPLQVDATSAYAYKLKGLDPATQIYADAKGPYNTYNHVGLPPTPIGNPGADAMAGAADPDKGNWLFYVNADKAGHLFFTNSESEFTKAVAKCRQNHWGCG
jgi:peptidoglycan lytic transglycosylase G